MLRLLVLFTVLLSTGAPSQSGERLFREDWKETPPELPLSQAHVSNPDLEVTLYGPGLHGIKKSHHDWIENDPYYVWSGACPGNWAVTLKSKRGLLDLSSGGIVRWRSKQAGFRQLRLLLKVHDGTWLVSEVADGSSADWRVFEIQLEKTRWRKLDISRVTEEDWVEHPALDAVEEVGFSDLMPGGLSAACSRLDWIEVYGRWAKVSP